MQQLCWTDTAIDTSGQDIPNKYGDGFLPKLNVFALNTKLASEIAVGKSRSALDGMPESHDENTGSNSILN